MKRSKILSVISLVLCICMILLCTGCKDDKTKVTSEKPKVEYVGIKMNVGCIKNDDSVMLVKLINEAENKKSANEYFFNFYLNEEEIKTALNQGSIDVGMLSLKGAAEYYTQFGNLQMLNIGVTGSLWLVENGKSVNELSDLKGKSLGVVGEGSETDKILRFLLRISSVDPDNIAIKYFESEQELCDAIATGRVDTAVLKETSIALATDANPELNIERRINLSDEWKILRNQELPDFCMAVNSDYATQHPSAVRKLNEEIDASVKYVASNKAEAAKLCEKYSVTDLNTARICLENTSPMIITGKYMQNVAVGYYSMLISFDLTMFSGKQPGEEFYFK